MTSTLPTRVKDALAVLPDGYAGLFDRLCTSVDPDSRIRAMWLSGSLARGVGDAGSDLDVILTVADESVDAFRSGWREWLATVTPTIIAHEIPGLPGSFFSVTGGCERFDVVVEGVADLMSTPRGPRLAVLDRDGLAGRLAIDPEDAAAGPNPRLLACIVEEFFRQQAIFPAAVVGRVDWLLGVVAVLNAQRLLYDLFVEANQPLPAMGVKQWSSRLTPDQRAVLEALPVPAPHPDEVVSSMLAVRRAMLTVGRQTVGAGGADWPTAMDLAVAAYWEKALGAAASDFSASPTTRIDSPGE